MTDTNWVLISGALKQVEIRNGMLYGVNGANVIYFLQNYKVNQNWKPVPGALSQISFDGTHVCGTINNEIYCAFEGVTTGDAKVRIS